LLGSASVNTSHGNEYTPNNRIILGLVFLYAVIVVPEEKIDDYFFPELLVNKLHIGTLNSALVQKMENSKLSYHLEHFHFCDEL
jgi:hypothetical protein